MTTTLAPAMAALLDQLTNPVADMLADADTALHAIDAALEYLVPKKGSVASSMDPLGRAENSVGELADVLDRLRRHLEVPS